jgi:group I intron endonuclease
MNFDVEKSNWRKTGVYSIINTINNKIYIGSTSTNFRQRYLQYCSAYKKELCNQPILFKAFKKYGFENFKFEIISICSKEDCIVTEQFFINKGTDYNSCLVAGSLLGLKHSENSKTRTIVGGLHHTSKKVFQFSKKGELIQKHNSIIEALKFLEKTKNGSSHISQSCLGITFSAFGFRWSFSEKLIKRENRLGKHNIKISKDNFSKKFHSHQEVVEYFNKIGFEKVKQGSISNAIRLNNKLYNYKIEKICVIS